MNKRGIIESGGAEARGRTPIDLMASTAELDASAQRERELRKIVLAWLNKKGYARAEEQFRREAEIAGQSCVSPARSTVYWRRSLPPTGSYAVLLIYMGRSALLCEQEQHCSVPELLGGCPLPSYPPAADVALLAHEWSPCRGRAALRIRVPAGA